MCNSVFAKFGRVLGLAVGVLAGHSSAATEPGEAAPPAAITLGMSYVVPEHQPGSKVRTPEGLAPLLADRLGKALPLQAVQLPSEGAQASGAPVDVLLLAVEKGNAPGLGKVIPTGYRAGIMAIMRTDTDIRDWEDLNGRTVCLAEGSGLAGSLQSRYGAVEKVFRAPADALLDLRIGGCDAAVHDSSLLEALLEFPEWQKFSARLPVQQERELSFVVPERASAMADVLQAQVQAWRDADLLATLTRQSARDIAFEVYMDQEVPDCH